MRNLLLPRTRFRSCLLTLAIGFSVCGCGGNSNEDEYNRTAAPAKPAEAQKVSERRSERRNQSKIEQKYEAKSQAVAEKEANR